MGTRELIIGKRVLIVAELSANHQGSLDQALETIQAAAEAGADAIKIQTYCPDTMTIDCMRSEFLIKGGPWDGRQLFDLYQEAHTPWKWHPRLMDEAGKLGLLFFSTPFDKSAVSFLAELGVALFKIASFELPDLELIEVIASQHKPIIMSTGMASLEEIGRAVSRIRSVWGGGQQSLILLKCVSAYPAAPEAMNLATIPHLADAFQVIPGLSDHTLSSAVAVASVVMGARVIEKHFTLCRSKGGLDSAFSIEPDELKNLVRDIRDVERAIGTVSYGVDDTELDSQVFRRSLFVVEDLMAGDTLTRQNLRCIRPGHGLTPYLLPMVLGRRVDVDVVRGTPLGLNLLKKE
ncbi:MAG: pseudaminic acid synthase [Deltaproteobacteria bacterium]|nr:pseudaminic acid synthase [Deltaproteobacteria bacterium]